MGKRLKIALIGNPNSGKSSLFNVLTGLNQRVGNFPGVTVDRKIGSADLGVDQVVDLLDLPGTYSLYPHAQDEQIACEVLRESDHKDHPDLAIVVADVTHLKRSLLLCSQVMDLGLPTVLALNMSDLLKKVGHELDPEALSKELGIPVVSISALKKKGIEDLKKIAAGKNQASSEPFFKIPAPFLEPLKTLAPNLNPYGAFQTLLKTEDLTQDPALQAKAAELRKQLNIDDPDALANNELTVRYDKAEVILSKCRKVQPTVGESVTAKLDKFFLHPILGYVIFIGILFTLFQSIFWLASYPMDLIDLGFGALSGWLAEVLPDGWLTDLVTQGLVPGLGGVVIFVPQIALLFMFIAIMEDSGYMSRVVFLMDRLMRPFGFSGKSVIPLVGGMACAIPSIMMARSIPNRKERLITIMVTPLMSCSARIPVYVLLIGMFVPNETFLGIFKLQGIVMTGMYFLGFFMALATAWVIKKILKYNSDAIFVTELPIFRSPRWGNVGTEMWQKSKTFVWEAGRVILAVSVVLWLLSSFAPGDRFDQIDAQYDGYITMAEQRNNPEEVLACQVEQNSERLKASFAGIFGRTIEPVIRPLGYDWKIGISLLTSFAAREVFVGTMATIYSLEEGDLEGDAGDLPLREKMRAEIRPNGRPVYSTATAVSLLLFYAFAMQCISTLAVAKRETGSWKLSGLMVLYLTGLAYVSGLIAYQTLSLFA